MYFRSVKILFVFVIIASFISLALYSSSYSAQNALSRLAGVSSIQLTEEEEERTVREVPEITLYIDYVATALLNQTINESLFPVHINLSAQDFLASFKKPPRLV